MFWAPISNGGTGVWIRQNFSVELPVFGRYQNNATNFIPENLFEKLIISQLMNKFHTFMEHEDAQ
jgi:hypothetical protein